MSEGKHIGVFMDYIEEIDTEEAFIEEACKALLNDDDKQRARLAALAILKGFMDENAIDFLRHGDAKEFKEVYDYEAGRN